MAAAERAKMRPTARVVARGLLLVAVTAAACGGPADPPGPGGGGIGAPGPPEPRPAWAGIRPTVPEPPGQVGALPLRRYLDVFARPGAPRPAFVFDGLNATGRLVPMLVRAIRPGGWVEIVLPLKPNGVTGWVRSRDVDLLEQRHRIVVDLSARILRHFVDGELEHRFRVGIGRPDAPTPTGRFYVWIRVPQRNPRGPYGAFALGLSGFSEVLDGWPGGGRLAIHGTIDPSDLRRRVSAGCVRVHNRDLRALRGVPLGTPVVIRR